MKAVFKAIEAGRECGQGVVGRAQLGRGERTGWKDNVWRRLEGGW